uniref:Gallerimycin n=1 Tax=Trichoplusia ni TaxID=7111 RepID=A9XXA9_TRINI|nr:gallerimycin [Trichoplusia ni]
MKACLVFAALVVLFAVVTFPGAVESANVPILPKVTIQGPTFPNSCVFYECIASCRQKGYRNGGYCTINGCQCLR